MKKPRIWTHRALLNAALCEIMRPATPVKIRELNGKHELAYSMQDPDTGKIDQIVLDPHLCGLIQAAIHEALHQVLFNDLKPFSRKIENEILTKLDNALFDRLRKQKVEMRRWRDAINRKAEEDRDRLEDRA